MSVQPMYRQIAEHLRNKIEAGELARGHRIPSETALMQKYNTSRNTIREAIKMLITRSLVETRPGQGTFVSEEIKPFVSTLTGDPQAGAEDLSYLAEAQRKGRVPSSREPRVEILKADKVIACALQVEEGADVISRHQRRFMDGIPWSLQTSFYPMGLIPRGATRLIQAHDIPEGTIRYLANSCGIKQAGYRDRIAVRSPGETETTFFELPADGRVAVFEIFRTAFEEHGDPFRLMVTIYPADRNQFLVNVGEIPKNHIAA